VRIYVGAFGDPGHAFPMIALGGALVERGHTVAMDTWQKWREPVEAAGMTFTQAPEYQVFPTREKPLKPYAAAVRAAQQIRPFVHDFAPDVAVADILTPGPALAAELEGVPLATLVPHVHPFVGEGHPIYSIGARLPRTPVGAALWTRANRRFVQGALEEGRKQYNETRRRLGLGPLPWVHTALSRELTLVGTLPQLEYPRRWEPWVRIVGPLQWEPPGERVEPPPGRGPVVLVAPSTSQDPEHRLLRAALDGLADAPMRVIATYNGREPAEPIPVPANATLVPWLSYAKTMPLCDVVVLHGGHGTLVRALCAGCSVVVCPVAGDMNENAARVDWAGVGRRIPQRWLGARSLRLAVHGALRPPARARAAAIARWAAAFDGAQTAVIELERWAALRRSSRRRAGSSPRS
jgi:UDP:flavonoid glycosyltransferase YjiC (YdhE family)